MADRTGLGIIGYILGGVTAAVIVIGVLVVSASLPPAEAASATVQLPAEQ